MRRLLLVLAVLAISAVAARAVEKAVVDRAIDRGAAALRKMQQPDGTWKHAKMGAAALAGLTLLECGAEADDKAVRAAAEKVRQASLEMTDTYSLALSVLFLDRLDVKTDTSYIESMLVRLLAGQKPSGAWTYDCPSIAAQEIRRLKAEGEGGRGRRDMSTLPAKGKRKPSDLPREVQVQLAAVANNQVNPGAVGVLAGDNSNTQFATLALWVGRRYGMPAQRALRRVEQYFRTQQHPDGGWSYTYRPPGAPVIEMAGEVTAAMTCAGLLGLAAGHGASLDIKKAKNPLVESIDVSKDAQLRRGLTALGTAVGATTGWSGEGRPAIEVPTVSGKGYYFLWSLERVAVAYGLDTIGKKDWYGWGAEVLLASQLPNGSWAGGYGECGADTCFALLFLKRANLTRDLSAGLVGGKGIDTVLKFGGVGGAGLTGVKKLAPVDIGGKSKPSREGETKPRTPAEAAAARLADDVVRGSGERRTALLKKLRDGKGPEYTEALAAVVARLDAEGKKQAREALADRLTRMKPATLREYFKDDDAEIRRAAALAAAQQDSKSLAPDLIRLLGDPQALVQRAAHAALKALAGEDFGPRSGADADERAKAVARWQAWWKKQARE